MELGRPFATVTPTLDGDVLAVLAQQDAAFTTGQLHRILTSYSVEGIRKVLVRLTDQGVVDAHRVGNAYSYRFNREHLASSPIMELAELQRTLLARLEERLAAWTAPPVYAAVFGSAARGTMTVQSDIDILVVRPDNSDSGAWEADVGSMTADVARWTGNDVRALQYTVAELRKARTEPVLADILTEGLTVAGTPTWLRQQLRRRRT